MNEVEAYNVDVERLQATLDGGDGSNYVWIVRGWGYDTEFEILKTAKELGTTEEVERTNALRVVTVKLRTKRSYAKGRMWMETYLHRELLQVETVDVAVKLLYQLADSFLEGELERIEAVDS